MPEPNACTLAADQLADRAGAFVALARRALREGGPIPGGERLVFADDPATERELRALIAAEAKCCGFLRMDLTPTPAGLQLDITGPDGAGPFAGASRILDPAWPRQPDSASSSSGTVA